MIDCSGIGRGEDQSVEIYITTHILMSMRKYFTLLIVLLACSGIASALECQYPERYVVSTEVKELPFDKQGNPLQDLSQLRAPTPGESRCRCCSSFNTGGMLALRGSGRSLSEVLGEFLIGVWSRISGRLCSCRRSSCLLFVHLLQGSRIRGFERVGFEAMETP